MVFCHNDVLLANVVILEDNVNFIDLEYGAAYDIANHFCEMAIENDVSRFPGFILHPDRYPDADEQDVFLRAYLEAQCAEGAVAPTDADVAQLVEEVRQCMLPASLSSALLPS